MHISYLEIYNENGYDLLDADREIKAMEDLAQVRGRALAEAGGAHSRACMPPPLSGIARACAAERAAADYLGHAGRMGMGALRQRFLWFSVTLRELLGRPPPRLSSTAAAAPVSPVSPVSAHAVQVHVGEADDGSVAFRNLSMFRANNEEEALNLVGRAPRVL